MKNPDVLLPAAAGAFGGTALAVGWWLGREAGFSIASGIVSVLGLVTSAFVARSIWSIRSSSRLTESRHLSLRRLESLSTEIQQAVENKERTELRKHLGALRAIIPTMPLSDGNADEVESMLNLLRDVESKDDRSTERLAKQLIPLLHAARTRIEIAIERKEWES